MSHLKPKDLDRVKENVAGFWQRQRERVELRERLRDKYERKRLPAAIRKASWPGKPAGTRRGANRGAK